MELLWDWRSIGSLLATMMFLRTAVRDFLPQEVQFFLRSLFARIFSNLRPTNTIIIDEYDSASSNTNDLFNAAHIYLSSRCLATAPVLRLSKPRNCRTLTSSLPASHTATDSFAGITLRWRFQSIDRPTSLSTSSFSPGASTPEHRYYELSFDRRHRDAVQAHYIPHVLDEAERIRFKSRERRLYTNRSIAGSVFDGNHGGIGNHLWSSVPFAHPSTFDTIAIDSALRDDIRADLLRFTASRDYYSRVGRAWKRGYLLHGPPGTGKTSLIAAIANFLEFDVYDIELTAVTSNSHLRKLLVSTTSKSVIVIEDVDCTLDLSDRKKRNHNHPSSFNIVHPNAELGFNEVGVVGFGVGVGLPQIPFSGASASASASASGNSGTAVSLSGVLNFVDGLWSSCVGERLMVFTTNHPERLDPALLRPGRMDRQIHLSYCGPEAFRTLAKNYLAVEGHELMAEVEQLLGEARITPAEVAELLMGCDGADIGMRKVLEEMRRRKAPPPPLRPHPNVAPTETSAVSLLYGGTMQTKDGLYKLLV